eukprot:Skav204880  [mRNA]  locus=scaffold2602:65440:67758:- [translate_table: standard]
MAGRPFSSLRKVSRARSFPKGRTCSRSFSYSFRYSLGKISGLEAQTCAILMKVTPRSVMSSRASTARWGRISSERFRNSSSFNWKRWPPTLRPASINLAINCNGRRCQYVRMRPKS